MVTEQTKSKVKMVFFLLIGAGLATGGAYVKFLQMDNARMDSEVQRLQLQKANLDTEIQTLSAEVERQKSSTLPSR